MHVNEHDAEAAVGEAMKQAGLRDLSTPSRSLAEGEVPQTRRAKISEQLFAEGSWYRDGALPDIYASGPGKGTDHAYALSPTTRVPAGLLRRLAPSSRNVSHERRTGRS